MSDFLDPYRLPDAARWLGPTLELRTALALADGPAPRAWLRCRSAAHRYVEAARAAGLGARVSLDLLGRAVDGWAAPALAPATRTRLRTALPVWVGSVYGLRWQAADRHRDHGPGRAVPPPGDGTHPSPGTVPPMRTDRDDERRTARAHSDAVFEHATRTRARSQQLREAAWALCRANRALRQDAAVMMLPRSRVRTALVVQP